MSDTFEIPTRFGRLPAELRKALAHVEFLACSDTTARLITAIGPQGSERFVPPEDLNDGFGYGQCFAHTTQAATVRAAIDSIGFAPNPKLLALLDTAQANDFRLYVNHHVTNRNGGAIGRIVEDDEWQEH